MNETTTTNETEEEKRRSGDYKNRFEKMYKKRVYTILGREGSNRIEKSETESSVCMEGTMLY